MAELCENISPGLLTNAASGVITRSCRMTASPERKENVHFLILLIPIKVLIIWMFLQHLFGG